MKMWLLGDVLGHVDSTYNHQIQRQRFDVLQWEGITLVLQRNVCD